MKFFNVKMLSALSLLFMLTSCVLAQSADDYLSISDDGAWCWFQDPRAVYHKGTHEKSYIGWVNTKGDVGVSSYDHNTGEVKKSVLRAKMQKDDHDNPAIIVRPDGRLVIFYTAHSWSKHPMYYRVSKRAEDITEWENEQSIRTNSKGPRGWCYPNPVQLSGENNRIYLFWRGANWKPTFSYTDDLKTWSKAQTLVQENGREASTIRPYVKISSNGIDSIDIAFTDGHPRDEAKNSIYYVRYTKGKFFKADGTLVGSLDSLPLKHSQTDVAYNGRETNVRGWIWDVASDKKGFPVMVYTRLPSETDHRYAYLRWNGKEWIDKEICKAGGWFPLTHLNKRRLRRGKEPEPHYSGGVVLDHENVNTVYLSKPVNGVFEIFKSTTVDCGENWTFEAVTKGSKYNNVRPFVIRNTPESVKPRITWMQNNGKYIHYTDYKSELKLDIDRSAAALAKVAGLASKTVEVTNPSNRVYSKEAVAVKVAELGLGAENLKVVDAHSGKLLVTQTVDLDSDGKVDELLFQSNFLPKQTKKFQVVSSKSLKAPEGKELCYGRHVPERMDDFAWENDKVAFRMYGPALEPKDGKASGVDIWSKRVSQPVINKWYKNGHYHNDHGEGADFYKVGPSRGCGGLGYLNDGKMVVSGNWKSSKIITTGPIRVMFELTYAPVKVGDATVIETKTISLDAGSSLNRFDSKFEISGGNELEVAVGIARRGNKGEMSYDLESKWFTYREPVMKNGNGTISSGVVLPKAKNFIDKFNHGLMTVNVKDGETISYYAGAGWSKFGFDKRGVWEEAVAQKAAVIQSPLVIKVR